MAGLHHIALCTEDAEATHRFYTELLGFPLVHTEIQAQEGAWVRHFFFDIGDGSCIAFFELKDAGEPAQYDTAISTGLGLPVWVNHIALKSEAAEVERLKADLLSKGVAPTMEMDHGWCQSVYYTDPNGNMIEFCVDTPGMPVDRDEALDLIRAVPETTSA